MQQPPVLVVSTLISAFPEAVSTKCHGNLPLHLALKHGATLDVIQTLVLAYPMGLEILDENNDDPVAIFGSHQKLWKSETDRTNIARVLEGGVDSIILDSGGRESQKQIDEAEQKKMSALNKEGWKKVRV